MFYLNCAFNRTKYFILGIKYSMKALTLIVWGEGEGQVMQNLVKSARVLSLFDTALVMTNIYR